MLSDFLWFSLQFRHWSNTVVYYWHDPVLVFICLVSEGQVSLLHQRHFQQMHSPYFPWQEITRVITCVFRLGMDHSCWGLIEYSMHCTRKFRCPTSWWETNVKSCNSLTSIFLYIISLLNFACTWCFQFLFLDSAGLASYAVNLLSRSARNHGTIQQGSSLVVSPMGHKNQRPKLYNHHIDE